MDVLPTPPFWLATTKIRDTTRPPKVRDGAWHPGTVPKARPPRRPCVTPAPGRSHRRDKPPSSQEGDRRDRRDGAPEVRNPKARQMHVTRLCRTDEALSIARLARKR